MKKQQNKVDEFFREALQDHTVVPSEAAKTAFLKEAATLEGSGKLNRKWYLYLSAVLFLVSISAGFFILRPVKEVKKTSYPNSKSTISNSIHDTKIKSSLTNQQSVHNIAAEKEKMTSTTNLNQNIQRNPKPDDIINTKELNPAIVHRNKFTRPEPITSAAEKNITINPPHETPDKQPAPETQPPVGNLALSDETIREDSLKNYPTKTIDTILKQNSFISRAKQGSGSNRKDWNIALGFYYAPEWLFNTLEGEKYVNNFGIEGTFHFGRYSIRTGAGLSITKGTNELSVTYNDYLGNYNKLDSIQFTWNATHSNLIPTYYFSHENVWDSLLKVADAKVVKRYTYLQVPLILGYDLWRNDRFSIGLRGGPILSVLLKTEVLSDNYDPGKNKIILINQITPERIQTNWQILGGINMTFHFSRRLGIELEPEIRYYFNSVYEKSDNDKKPWSVGIHAAFIVIL